MSYEQIARQHHAREQINKQVQTVYEDYKKIKGFKDVGYLLEDYVVSGGEVTRDPVRNDTVHVSDIVASLNDNMMSREGHSFKVDVPNTTYYLDFNKDGDWHWGLAHEGVDNEDYLAIASVTTNASGLVQTITDLRGHVGGTRFKDDFGLEQYAKQDYVNAQLADIAINVNSIEKVIPENDDTGRIQRAIDKAASLGTEKVILSNEVYQVSYGINLRSNVSLIGGFGTTIKVADHCTGFYSLISIKSVRNVSISGITFDGNYDREHYDISDPLKPEITIYVVDSENVRITDNIFNSCGVWTISCEVSATWPYNDNIYIKRNTINYRVGKNSKTPDSSGWTVDTTQVYIDAKNYWVTDNIINTEETDAETAIEAHRRNGFVFGNVINGFRNGVLIVPGFFAEDSNAANINVSNNNFYNVNNGVTLWQVSARDLDRVVVSKNTIEPNPARFMSVESSKGITVLDTLPSNNDGRKVKNVQISHNIIKFVPFTKTFNDAAYVLNFVGIHLRSWVSIENIQVDFNQIINAPATGIVIGNISNETYNNTSKDIFIENNTIINAGINENIASQTYNPRCAIRINGGTGSSVIRSIVQNNKIIDEKPVGTYFTTPIYAVVYDINSCTVFNNPILANGYSNINTPKSYSISWRWDSQVGTPGITASANYIKDEFTVKLIAHLEITSVAGFTQGFGSYITLPVVPKETRNIPVVVINNTANVLRTWHLEVVNGNVNAYIKGLNSDNSLASLTQTGVQVGTKLSIYCEYIA